jgi:hypothetical protein
LCFAKDTGIGKTGRERYIIELGIIDWLQVESIRAVYPVSQGIGAPPALLSTTVEQSYEKQ